MCSTQTLHVLEEKLMNMIESCFLVTVNVACRQPSTVQADPWRVWPGLQPQGAPERPPKGSNPSLKAHFEPKNTAHLPGIVFAQ